MQPQSSTGRLPVPVSYHVVIACTDPLDPEGPRLEDVLYVTSSRSQALDVALKASLSPPEWLDAELRHVWVIEYPMDRPLVGMGYPNTAGISPRIIATHRVDNAHLAQERQHEQNRQAGQMDSSP